MILYIYVFQQNCEWGHSFGWEVTSHIDVMSDRCQDDVDSWSSWPPKESEGDFMRENNLVLFFSRPVVVCLMQLQASTQQTDNIQTTKNTGEHREADILPVW